MGVKFSLSAKIFCGFLVVVFLMIALSVIGSTKVAFIDDTINEMTNINALKQRYAINYRGSVHDRSIAVRDVVLENNITPHLEQIAKLESFYNEAKAGLNDFIAKKLPLSSKELALLKRIEEINVSTVATYKQIIAMKQNSDTAGAAQLLSQKAAPLFVEWLATINNFIDYQENANKNLTGIVINETSGFTSVMAGLTIVAMVIALLIGFLISREIKSQIGGDPREVNKIIAELAKGNLNIKAGRAKDGSILAYTLGLQAKLKEIVESINASVGVVKSQTADLKQAFAEVTKTVSHQSDLSQHSTVIVNAAKDETSTVAAKSSDTEKNSIKATELCESSKISAIQVAKKMEEINENVANQVEQIRQLSGHAKDIGGAAEIIAEITDQTNLLALNAAIEAARAGEVGRGFAVVADEIRQLAEKTGDATGQISQTIKVIQAETERAVEIIELGVPKVKEGYELSNAVAEQLGEIYTQSSDSTLLAKDVASAAHNQSDSMTKLYSNIAQINDIAQSTNAEMQKNSEDVKELEKIAKQLSDLVGFFKV